MSVRIPAFRFLLFLSALFAFTNVLALVGSQVRPRLKLSRAILLNSLFRIHPGL